MAGDFSPVDRVYQKRWAKQLLMVLDFLDHHTVRGDVSKKEWEAQKKARAEVRRIAKKLYKKEVEGLFKDPDDWNVLG